MRKTLSNPAPRVKRNVFASAERGLKNVPSALRGDRLRRAAQNAFADSLGLGAGMRVLGYLVEGIRRFAEAKVDRQFAIVTTHPQTHLAPGLLRIHPAFLVSRRLGAGPMEDDVAGAKPSLRGGALRVDTLRYGLSCYAALGVKTQHRPLVQRRP